MEKYLSVPRQNSLKCVTTIFPIHFDFETNESYTIWQSNVRPTNGEQEHALLMHWLRIIYTRSVHTIRNKFSLNRPTTVAAYACGHFARAEDIPPME